MIWRKLRDTLAQNNDRYETSHAFAVFRGALGPVSSTVAVTQRPLHHHLQSHLRRFIMDPQRLNAAAGSLGTGLHQHHREIP